jgi:hypothetical protein
MVKMKNAQVFKFLFASLFALGLLFCFNIKIAFADACTGLGENACKITPGCSFANNTCSSASITLPKNPGTCGKIDHFQCGTTPGCTWSNEGQGLCVGNIKETTPTSSSPCSHSDESGLDLFACFKLNASQSVASVYSNPAVFINLIVRIIFIASGIILFLMIIYSGFLFVSGSSKGMEEAQKVMTSAVVGFIIVFSAFWIMQIIKLVTGADIGF